MNKKAIIPLAIVTVLVIVLGFGFITVNRSKLKNQENEAEFFIEKGDYVRAQEEYQRLFEQTNKSKYAEKRDALNELVSSKVFYDEGKKYFDEKQWLEGLRSFSKIKEEDEAHRQEATKLIKEKLDNIKKEASRMASEGLAIDDMTRMVQSFIPEAVLVEEGSTEEVSNEMEQVDQEGNEDQAEEQSGENTRPSKKEKELLKEAEKKAKKNKDQDDQVGKTVKTKVSYSNVRSGPGLDYSIVTAVSKGSRVFIYEAEGEYERTWYHGIITSSETGNSYDAWISSKNLE